MLTEPMRRMQGAGTVKPDLEGWYVATLVWDGYVGHGRSRRQSDALAFAFEALARQLYQGPPREVRR